MNINPGIFKAYDIRGLYPSEINEEIARQIGRGFARICSRRRSACRATCASPRRRLPLPSSRACAMQGVDVVDYGMLGTDQCSTSRSSRTARRRRADHRLAQSRAVQRHQDGARGGASAQRRRRHRRHPRHDRRRPPPAARRRAGNARGATSSPLRREGDVVHRLRRSIKPFTVVLDAGSGMAGPGGSATVRSTAVPGHASSASRSTARFPTTRPTRSSRRTARDITAESSARRPTSASPGMATPTAASSSTAAASSSPATSSRRCWPRPSCSRTPARRSSTTSAPATP